MFSLFKRPLSKKCLAYFKREILEWRNTNAYLTMSFIKTTPCLLYKQQYDIGLLQMYMIKTKKVHDVI